MRMAILYASFVISLTAAMLAGGITQFALSENTRSCVERDEAENCTSWDSSTSSSIIHIITSAVALICLLNGISGEVESCREEPVKEGSLEEWPRSPVAWPTCIADNSTSDIENQSSTQVEMKETSTESKEDKEKSKSSNESTSSQGTSDSQEMSSIAASTGFFKTSKTPERDNSSDEENNVKLSLERHYSSS